MGAIQEAGLWLVTAAAVVLPLVFDPGAAVSFALPKAEALGILAYALAATLVLLVLTAGRRAIPMSWVHLPVGVYLATLVLASIFAVDRNLALWGAYDRRLGLIASLQLGVLYLAAATFVRTRRATATVFLGAAGGGVLVLSYALLQRADLDPIRWAEERLAFASLGNSNVLGHYFATLAGAAFAALLVVPVTGSRSRRLVFAALFLAFVVGTASSGARAAFLGLGAGVVVAVGITAWGMIRSRRGQIAAMGLTLGVVMITGAIVAFTPIGTRIAALASGTDLSVGERALLYGTISQIVSDHPILGIGPDNFPAVYNVYRPVEALHFAGPLLTQSSAHGWPWRAALDAGVSGLLVFAAFVATIGVVALRQIRLAHDWRGPVLAVALASYLSGGVFTISHLGTEWMLWLATGLLVGASAERLPLSARPLRGPRALVAVALALGLLWPIGALINDVGASRTFVASRSVGQREAAGRVVLARTAAEADGRWPTHWNNLGLRAVEAGDQAAALAAFERAADVGPYDPLIWKNLGTVQAQLAETQPLMRERARLSAERAVAADPRNPEAHAGAAQIYIVLGDNEAAVREAETAVALGPEDSAYLELAANAYMLTGRPADARKAILSALEQRETLQRRMLLARAYVLEQRYAEARVQLQRVLEIDPNNRDATNLLAQITGR